MSAPVPWRSAPVIAALTVGFVLRLYFAFATPIGSASVPGYLSSYNDEIAHGNYIHYVSETGDLPPHVESIEAAGALTRGQFENYQPPLYYLVVAGICTVVGMESVETAVLIGRISNLILFLGVLWIFLKLCGSLGCSSVVTQAGLIFLALSGVTLRFSSTATNEVLFWVLGDALIWAAIRVWQVGFRLQQVGFFVVIAIAALYTKLTALLFLPLIAIPLFRRRELKTVLLVSAAYAATLLATLPIWLRNVSEFGSLLPFSAGFGHPASASFGIDWLLYVVRSFVFPWSEFWQGWLGLLLMLPLLIYFGFVAFQKSIRKQVFRHPVLVTSLSLTIVAFLWLNTRYDQAEARYLFAAWPVIALCFGGSERKYALWLPFAALVLPYGLFLLPALGI